MREGGKYKGSADLPSVQHIDVRKQIAKAAGVCERNVSNVKDILQAAHPRLIEALQNGTLTINAAMMSVPIDQSPAVGAIHAPLRGMRDQQGDPSINPGTQRTKSPRRDCGRTRRLATAREPTAWVSFGA